MSKDRQWTFLQYWHQLPSKEKENGACRNSIRRDRRRGKKKRRCGRNCHRGGAVDSPPGKKKKGNRGPADSATDAIANPSLFIHDLQGRERNGGRRGIGDRNQNPAGGMYALEELGRSEVEKEAELRAQPDHRNLWKSRPENKKDNAGITYEKRMSISHRTGGLRGKGRPTILTKDRSEIPCACFRGQTGVTLQISAV